LDAHPWPKSNPHHRVCRFRDFLAFYGVLIGACGAEVRERRDGWRHYSALANQLKAHRPRKVLLGSCSDQVCTLYHNSRSPSITQASR
jgi:hypothetical protein